MCSFDAKKEKVFLFLEMQVTRKSLTGRQQIYFFNRYSGDILLSSLVSFAFFYSSFFLFV